MAFLASWREKTVRCEWLEIFIRIDPIAFEAVGAHMFDLGCEGVVTEDSGLRAYLSVQGVPGGVQDCVRDILDRVRESFPEIAPPRSEIKGIEAEDWALNWRRYFRPQRVTKKLLVLPAWEPVPEEGGGCVIRMDPGPAFGTGQHPTTKMCLRAMEESPLSRSWTMMDVGTGSAILAIYAAKLGARPILALDVDSEALRWAHVNIALNGLSGAIRLSSQPVESCSERFSMVAANLTLDIILELFPHFPRLVEPGGRLILSGILGGQVAELEKPLEESGLVQCSVLHEEEWAALVAQKFD